MKIINVTQGSPEWHAHRATHFNASDAPAMMGCSPYETRDQLIARLATGVAPEVDAATQRIFDRGHELEAFARPLAVAILGEDLYPVTGTNGEYSASFDGLTMDERTGWECKSLNDELRKVMPDHDGQFLVAFGHELPLMYQVQMEHQCMVSGAERVLFTATDGTDTRHCWYRQNPDLQVQIAEGWQQLAKDIAAYVPPAPKVEVVAETVVLPAVSLSVSGALTVVGNLPEFHGIVKAYIERLPAKPETDQHFADLERAVKVLKESEDKLAAAEANALAQTASVEEMRRTVATIMGDMRNARLAAEKLVKSGKDARKQAIVMAAKKALHEFEEPLQERTRHHLPVNIANWEGVTRGLKTLESFQSKVNDELARCKIEQMQEANRIERCLKLLDEAGMPSLFPDESMLVKKQPDDLAAVIAQRKAKHEADVAEAARKEAERKAAKEAQNAQTAMPLPVIDQAMGRILGGTPPRQAGALPSAAPKGQPSVQEIILVLSDHFEVPFPTVRGWLRSINWTQQMEAA